METKEFFKKLNKQNMLELLIITITTIILCSNFLQMHFSSDTYVLYDLGYFKYPSEYFLVDGRVISALVCYCAGFLNLPIPAYIVGMDFIGIIFLSLSIYLISKVIRETINPQNQFWEVLIILASHLLIFNQYALEYLLFPESAVMCMGVFFLVLAIKVLVQKPKHTYLKIFICLLITGISYQGELNIFPLLAILVYILKQIKGNKKIGTFLKEFLIEMLKLAAIIIGVLFITLVIIKIGKTLLNNADNKLVKIVSYRTFKLRLKNVLLYANELWNNCMHMLPKDSINIAIAITLVLLIFSRAKKQTIINYIFLIIVAMASSILPLFIFNAGICGRLSVPIMMIFGISAIILIANAQYISTKYCKNIIGIFIIFLFSINAIFIIQNTSEHIAANRVDENTGKTIKHLIEKYEAENNITVTKLGYKYDFEPQQFAVGIKPMQSMTERKFACSWSVVYTMNYYCGKKFEVVPFSPSITAEDVSRSGILNFDEFSEEQIIFEDDTIYMIIY